MVFCVEGEWREMINHHSDVSNGVDEERKDGEGRWPLITLRRDQYAQKHAHKLDHMK